MAGAVWDEPEMVELRGECDRCHGDADLYQVDDDPGAWLFCYSCALTFTRYRVSYR